MAGIFSSNIADYSLSIHCHKMLPFQNAAVVLQTPKMSNMRQVEVDFVFLCITSTLDIILFYCVNMQIEIVVS